MIEYEINDDLNISSNRNQAEIQLKNFDDENLNLKVKGKNQLSKNNRKYFSKENLRANKYSNLKIDMKLNCILQGSTVKSINHNLTSKSNKNETTNFTSTMKPLSLNKKNSINNNYLSLKTNSQIIDLNNNPNLFTNDSSIGNVKLFNQCKNLNTISNMDIDCLLNGKNKNTQSHKKTAIDSNFTNTNDNNYCSSILKQQKSHEFDKTKSITNNKTDYKTLNSNNGNSMLNTLNSTLNQKYSKFEVRLLDHFQNLKNQKINLFNNPTKKDNKKNFNLSITKIKDNNFNSAKKDKIKNQRIKKDSKIYTDTNNIVTVNTDKNLKNNINNFHDSNNDNISNKKSSYINLKLNLDGESNLNTHNLFTTNNFSNSIDARFVTTSKNEEKIKYLLSDQFKTSMDTSLRNSKNQSYLSKANKYTVKKSYINFDLDNSKGITTSISTGERLYRKSVALKDMKEKKASFELHKKEMDTINNCSFRPTICEDSIMLNIKVFLNTNSFCKSF